jgi:hypothetical protein
MVYGVWCNDVWCMVYGVMVYGVMVHCVLCTVKKPTDCRSTNEIYI